MAASRMRTLRPGARLPLVLEDATDETLRAARLCDLPLQLDGTLMARRVQRLHRELQAHDIVALPHSAPRIRFRRRSRWRAAGRAGSF